MTSNSTSLTPVRRLVTPKLSDGGSFSEGGKTNSTELSVQRRINAVLVAITIAIIVLIARTSAHAAPLYWDTDNSLGLQAGPGTWSIANGAANQRWSNVPTGSNPAPWTQNSDAFFQTSGTSAITVSGVGASAITVNSITFNGTGYTISGDPLTLTGTGGLITTNGSAIINASLQGTVGLTKLGSATLTLGVANTYSGATQVSGGTLLVVGSTPTGSAVTVSNVGTVLGGTGTVGGTVSITAGATINAGLSGTAGTALAVGNLATGALTLSGALHTDASGTAATAWDKVVSSGAITLGPLSTLDVTIASGLNFTAGSTYVLLSGTALTGVFSGILDGQTYNFSGYDFIADYTTTGFNLVVVPEPSTWMGAVLALAAIGFMQRKRLGALIRQRAS